MAAYNDRTRALIEAVKYKKKDKVTAEIKDGADVNITDIEGKTALFYAVQQSNNESVVRSLIDAGANVNVTDIDGYTVLFDAVGQSNNESMVRILIDAGADVNITNDEGYTSLLDAVLQSNNESVVRALIDAGADVNITNNERKSALFYAVQQSNNESLVHELIDAGANVNITDNEGKTALFYAVESDNDNIVTILIKHKTNINETDNDGQTALHYAVFDNNTKIAHTLIQYGADVNIPNKRLGNRVLSYAVQNDNEGVVQALIDAGADLNARDYIGKSALFYAVLNQNESVLPAMIDVGADATLVDTKGRSVLFYAVMNSKKNLVHSLLKYGVDVNVMDKKGKTALSYAFNMSNIAFAVIEAGADTNVTDDKKMPILIHAVRNHSVYFTRLLLKHRADVNIKDNESKTALIYAVINSNKTIFQTLIAAGADVNVFDGEEKTALMYAVLNENEFLVQELIDVGADVNAFNGEKKTALVHAVLKNNESLVQALINAGAYVNIIDNEGKSVLFYAVQSNIENVVHTLIDVGADVNITDNEGKSVLIYAVQQRNNESMVSALITAGADVTIIDNKGKTALFYAVDNKALVSILVMAGADTSVADYEYKSPLFYAVADEEVVRKLVENGRSDIDQRDIDGRTPIFYAFTKSLGTVRYLISKGSVVCCKDNYHLSALSFFIHDCLNNGKESTQNMSTGIAIFLKEGLSMENVFKSIINAVFCKILSSRSLNLIWPIYDLLMLLGSEYLEKVKQLAAKLLVIQKLIETIKLEERTYEDLEERWEVLVPKILEALIKKAGANPNSVDSEGNTALHYAGRLPYFGISKKTVMSICEHLKSHGASFNTKNVQNETPLLFCLSAWTSYEIVNSQAKLPHIQSVVEVCTFLVGHGSNLNEITKAGESVFHLILKIFQYCLSAPLDEFGKAIAAETVKLLELVVHARVNRGLAVGRRNTDLDTPLHLWAVLNYNSRESHDTRDDTTFKGFLKIIFERLLESGAQVNDRNANQQTPLHHCKTWAAVKLLLDAGANPNDVDSFGRTPLFVAAENINVHQVADCIYPDVHLGPKEFWITALEKGLDPWTANKSGQSVMSILVRAEAYTLAKALLEVAIEKKYIESKSIAASLLNAICEDDSPRSQWKGILVQIILESPNTCVLGNEKEDTPLHKCCRNIVRRPADYSRETKQPVHWVIAKQLLLFGASCTIRNAEGLTCLDIANTCPELRQLLLKPIDIDEFPLLIPWKSVSRIYEQKLAKVARRQECDRVEHFWYHREHLASGSFGFVFAGINEKDGREVAIKRIETLRMERPEDKREISNLITLADCEQVVRYLSFCEDERFTYVVLELMEGNLEEYLDNALDAVKCTVLCKDVVAGLRYLHDQNVLHRDIKPTNMLYKTHPKLCLKIADFGLSRRIDNTGSTSVYSTNAGTRCWIAPEVLKSTKEHSKSSDLFSCGLVLHYILSVKKHPFAPTGCAKNSQIQITKIQTNIMENKLEGWDSSLSLEAQHLVEMMIRFDENDRPSAAEALSHPFFWCKEKKLDFLSAVGNQPEFECPRAKVTHTSAVEDDLEASFGTIVRHGKWNDPGYVHMPGIYTEMMLKRKMPYDHFSTVELVRFIRNAIAHVSGTSRSTLRKKQLLEDFVFLEYFPNLVMKVYKAVITNKWDQTREEIKYALKK